MTLDDSAFGQTFREAESGERHSGNIVNFYYHPVLNPKKTEEQGQEVYEDKVYVLILSPGQKLSEVRRKATDKDFANYPKQYEAILQKKAQPIIGTPLTNLPGLAPSRVKSLEYLNIRTVQHLLDIPDSILPKVGPDARRLQDQARAFLEKNDSRVVALERQLKEMQEKIDKLTSAPSQEQKPVKRRGRPPGSRNKPKVNGTHEFADKRTSGV